MRSKLRLPSPAMGVALVALLVALSGTAVAATAIVPLAKRALVADNAKKLNGQTPGALIQQASQAPGPASSAAGLITVKSATWNNNPGVETNVAVMCDAGQKVLSGGWSDPGDWSQSYQSYPTPDGGGWTREIYTSIQAPGGQSGTLYAICLK